MDPITLLLALVPAHYAIYVLAASGVCAVIDAILPQPASGSWWVPVRKAIGFFGANVMHARNASVPGSK